MSFGKRTRTRPNSSLSAHDGGAHGHARFNPDGSLVLSDEAEIPLDEREDFKDTGRNVRGVVRFAVITCILLPLSLCTPWIVSAGLGNSASGSTFPFGYSEFSSHAAINELPAAQLERKAMTDQIMSLCLPPLNAHEQSLFGDDPAFGRRLHKLANGTEAGLASYITCSMRAERLRLCKPEHRADLVAELETYFHMNYQRRKKWDEMFGQEVARKKLFGGALTRVRNVTGEDASANPGKPPRPNREVITGMRYLISTGYLSVGDFGWFPPDEIKPHLKDITETGKACG